MHHHTLLPLSRLLLGAVTVAAMASCSLPPREAWRRIQDDGLIPFVMNEWKVPSAPSKPSSPLQTTHSQKQMLADNAKKEAPASAPTLTLSNPQRTDIIGPPLIVNNTPSPSMIDSTSIPKAQAVPGLVGYVRTPYTTPPRLVDVRGMDAGSKVVCPYTHKPFLVPAAAVDQKIASNAPATLKKQAPSTPAPSKTLAANDKPAPASSAPTKTASTQTQPKTEPTSPPATKPEAETPFGLPIAGRPGFVNSPFAARHQLVDVTGLPVGMEVKCPYTGKLFRVPPQDMATNQIPVTNTASPQR